MEATYTSRATAGIGTDSDEKNTKNLLMAVSENRFFIYLFNYPHSYTFLSKFSKLTSYCTLKYAIP